MSNLPDVKAALDRLRSGSASPTLFRSDCTAILTAVLSKEDYRDDGPAEGADLTFRDPEPESDSWFRTLGVSFLHRSGGPVKRTVGDCVRSLGKDYDRALVIADSPFTQEERESATSLRGDIELFEVDDLQRWAERSLGVPAPGLSDVARAVKRLARELVQHVASRPSALLEIEWRDLERLVAEAFEGLGFAVELTPSSKDGGKDVVLQYRASRQNDLFLVEVKHWTSGKRVGEVHVTEFIEVVATYERAKGLMLSSSGYTSGVVEARGRIERQRVRLGDGQTIVALCKMYVRAQSQLWSIPENLPDVVFPQEMDQHVTPDA